MAGESTPPPPTGGGNLKYAIIGVVLLGGAIALWLGMQSCEGETATGPSTPVMVDAGTPVERSTALTDETLLIPELEPDAGPTPDAGRRVRYVTRYVGGGGGGDWNCSGNLSAAAARAALAQSNLQFRNCYERRLKVNQTLEGRVNVRMKVDRSGSVSAVQVGGSLRDAQVLSCVRGIAQRITFPRPEGGACATVSVPFNFTPQN